MYRAYGYKRRTAKAKPTVQVVEYSIDDVFAAAAVAQSINGRYIKDNCVEWTVVDGKESSIQLTANKHLVKSILVNPSQISNVDRSEGAAVRSYWKMKMFAILKGGASDYISKAVELASRESIASNDNLSLAIISSLPSGYARGMVQDAREEVKQDSVLLSEHQGKIGDHITGRVKILDCIFSKNWQCYYITGKINHNVFLWASKVEVKPELEFNLKGRVKGHRDNNITQLNYVKLT